jgi:hypothetical protein
MDVETGPDVVDISGLQPGVATSRPSVSSTFAPVHPSDANYDLPHEVHPLSDLSSTITSHEADPTPWERELLPAMPDLEDDLTEVQRIQLAQRRATVVVPPASVVFPITESPSFETPLTPPTGPSPPSIRQQGSVGSPELPISPFISSHPGKSKSPMVIPPRMRSLASADIAPFEFNPASPFSPKVDTPPRASVGSLLPSLATRQDSSTLPTYPPRTSSTPGPEFADLQALLARFKRDPVRREEYAAEKRRRKKEIRVFGPEKLVEDPRVRSLMERIVRDILIVGAITAVVWVAVCLAVPMRG